MRDVFGREIAVGQEVAFMLPGYRDLRLGRVMAITPQRVRVAYTYQGHEDTYLTPGNNVAIRPD